MTWCPDTRSCMILYQDNFEQLVVVTTADGDTYLTGTVDTSHPNELHTGECLAEVAKEHILKCEREFSCRVRSFVTDNAANVAKMRRLLTGSDDNNADMDGSAVEVLLDQL
jgi:hypothetical protein